MLTNSFLVDILLFLTTLLFLVRLWFKKRYQHWEKLNIPYITPSIPFGNMDSPLKTRISLGDKIQNLYKEIRSNNWNKHAGIFILFKPIYIPIDLDLIKCILVKDFNNFVDRGVYYNEKVDPIGAHLFSLTGNKWRNLRAKLSPTFTSGKIKMMLPKLIECEADLKTFMLDLVQTKEPVNIRKVVECFTLDVIASCAFGLNTRSTKETNSPFIHYGTKVFNPGKVHNILGMIAGVAPELGKLLNLRQIPKDVGDFYTEIVTETVKRREENNIVQKDFLQLLIDLKNDPDVGKRLTLDEIVAQAFIFFLGGFETSSTSLTFLFYEISKNQEIQDKMREEILGMLEKNDQKIVYEGLNELKYTSQVIDGKFSFYFVVDSSRFYPNLSRFYC